MCSSKHSAARQRQQGSAPGEEAGTVGVSEPMHLAVVACGSRLEETLIMLKSALLFSRRTLRFHIFAEDELHSGFTEAVSTVIDSVLLFHHANFSSGQPRHAFGTARVAQRFSPSGP